MKRSDLFNIATTMHMAYYVSRLSIVCLIFKIRTFFITYFFAWLFLRICILPICEKTCMTASFHYKGKFGPIKLAVRLHMLLESLHQARQSSGHIYVCLVYRLSLCDFSIEFWNSCDSVIFFVFHFIPLLSHYCTLYSSSYSPSDLHQNVVIVNTNRNTKDLLFKSLFSVYCFVDHFRVLVTFFHLVVVLSISLKEQFEDTKGVVKTRKLMNGHYNDKHWSMKLYTEN